MKVIAALTLSALVVGCATLQRQMAIDATGAAHATTPETAPVALFAEEDAAATSQIIADWCSGDTVLESEANVEALAELLGDLASPGSVDRNLDSQSDEMVECRVTHDRSTRYSGPAVGPSGTPTGGTRYDLITEWVTFTLRPAEQGGTCVVGAPEVRRTGSERQMGSFTNIEEVLDALGASVAPEDQATCRPESAGGV